MSLRLGILGYPLGHTISPAIQQAALDRLGIDARYEPWEVSPGKLAEEVERLRSPDVLGANVTVPHKEAIIPLLDSLDGWAETVGAVNTIVNQDGKLCGYNTDSYGFTQGLEEASFDASRARVLIIGAGGAARGVALALAGMHVSSIAIANRTVERAEKLTRELQSKVPDAKAVPLESGILCPVALRSDLIVNCTSLGMRYSVEEGATPLYADCITEAALAYDLVYNPLDTPFLREARRAGARTMGGLRMLVHQGAASLKLWTGQEAPVEVMMEAALAALGES